MAIPEEILAVERPKNTAVVDRGGKDSERYIVVERAQRRRVGHGSRPCGGTMVGTITDGRFVARKARIETDADKLRERAPRFQPVPSVRFFWGAAEAMRTAYDTCGIREDLTRAFGAEDATAILAVACLRVLRPHVSDRDIADVYASSWVSEILPGACLTEDGLTDVEASIGQRPDKVSHLMRRRVRGIAKGHRIAICRVSAASDAGTSDSGAAHLSRLARMSPSTAEDETRNTFVVYALDADEGTPVCDKTYPGTVPFEDAIADLTSEFGIEHNLVVGDADLTADLVAVLNGCGRAPASAEAGMRPVEPDVGEALLDFVAACIGMRLMRLFDEAHLLDEATFAMVMDELSGTVMVGSYAMRWELVCATRHSTETLRALGLVDSKDVSKNKLKNCGAQPGRVVTAARPRQVGRLTRAPRFHTVVGATAGGRTGVCPWSLTRGRRTGSGTW